MRDSIASSEYAPGQRLPGRTKLADHFGVAQMTVQNALRTLQEEGLIVSRQGSGTSVLRAPAPQRDLAAEIDDLRSRVEALERDRQV